MYVESPKCRIIKQLYFVITVLLLISSVIGRACSLLNSIALIALLGTWLFEGNFSLKYKQLKHQPLFIILLAFYACYLTGLLYSANESYASFVAQRELPLLIIPMVLLSKHRFSKEELSRLYTYFTAAAFIWLLIATAMAVIAFYHTGDSSVFFYHQLVSPLGSTAIYASMVCLMVLIVMEKTSVAPKWKYFFYAAFTFWLLLLSAKMFLFIYVILLLIFFLYHGALKHRLLIAFICLFIFIGGCFVSKPLQRRIQDLAHFKAIYLTEARFNPHLYFDGLSLRLVYVRFSLEILKESKNLLFGVGTGDSGDLLKEKIRQYHMYTGEGLEKNGGYLRYSYHNVYLESLVSMGLIGLAVNLLFFGYILYVGIKRKDALILSLAVVIILSASSDVIVLNSQFDITMIMVILCPAILVVPPGRQRSVVQILNSAN